MTHRLERVTLPGHFVSLVPLTLAHAEPLEWAASPSRTTYSLTIVPDGVPAMRQYIETLLAEEARGETLPFAVVGQEGEVLGATRFMSIEWWKWPGDPPPPLPNGPDVLEIGGTWYAERVQRTAANTEAKLLMCTYAFEVLGVRRVAWKTDARNTRSRDAILRLGAKFDGILRAQRAGADGVVRDSAYFSMLHAEWAGAKQRLVERLARR